MKSFEMYPPLGESAPAKEKSTSILSSVASFATKAVDKVGDGLYDLTHSEKKNVVVPEDSKVATPVGLAHSTLTPEAKNRNDKISKIADKLQERFKSLDTFFESGQSEVNPVDNHLTRAKVALEENGKFYCSLLILIRNETKNRVFGP